MAKLIKCKEHKEIFIIEDGKKCWIENWATYVYMGFGPVEKEVDIIPFEELRDRYPVGPTKVKKTVTAIAEGSKPRDIFYPERSEQRKMSILWMGDERWETEFGGTHIVGFHEPCRPQWYPPSKIKLISYLKADSYDNDRIRARVGEAKDHPNHGGTWLISGHEPDITGVLLSMLARGCSLRLAVDVAVEKYGGADHSRRLIREAMEKIVRQARRLGVSTEEGWERHKQRRIEQYGIIRAGDPDSWNHPNFTFYDMTSAKDFEPGAYPGWENAFTGDDHDVWVIDCYPNKKDGTLDYRGMEKAANVLVKIGFERSKGQFVPNLGACYMDGEKPASLVKQFEFWNERFDIQAVCFWNSGIGSWAIGIYENDFLAEEAKEINRRLGLLE